jgi:hypothetical protein
MKRLAIFLCILLLTHHLRAQKFPIGSWSITSDAKGNPIDNKKSNGSRQVTSFDFADGTKYSFLYEEYDSTGRKTVGVKESGIYSVNASQFILTPTKSTTTFFEYLTGSNRPVSNSMKENALAAAIYNWSYQKEGAAILSIEPVRAGHREGVFAGTKAKSTSVMPRRRDLTAVRTQVRAL